MADLENIMHLVHRVIEEMERNGIRQWNETYPHRQTFAEDLASGNLYLGFYDEALAAMFVLNETMTEDECRDGNWRFPTAHFAVIHRLCVDPAFQQNGLGRRTCLAAEETARDLGYDTIRIDAFSQNPYALRMYEKLAYTRVGETLFPEGLFFLMEKKL